MASKRFMDGIGRLRSLGHRHPMAIMYAERESSNCHRNLIADSLTLRGWQVQHLLAPGNSYCHILNPLARTKDQQLIYDRLDEEQLKLSF